MRYTLVKDQGRLAFFDEEGNRHVIVASGHYNRQTEQNTEKLTDTTTVREVQISIEWPHWYVWYVE